MIITIAAATHFEITENLLRNPKHDVGFLYTGIGILSSTVSLTQHVFQQKPDLIIQAGIAGCFDKEMELGNVVVVDKEYMGDVGVWENNEWKDLFDMKLQTPDDIPFANSCLENEQADALNVLSLRKVTGVTINEITTQAKRCDVLTTKYGAVIESMEGASLHYVGRLFSVPFIQIRGVSNYIGERDRSNWRMKKAIENVNEAVKKMIAML